MVSISGSLLLSSYIHVAGKITAAGVVTENFHDIRIFVRANDSVTTKKHYEKTDRSLIYQYQMTSVGVSKSHYCSPAMQNPSFRNVSFPDSVKKLFLIILLSALPAFAEEKISYAREILPILSDKCFHCHGPDKEQQEADLRLDIRADAIADNAIDPKHPAKSEVLIRIFSDDEDEIMPPPDSHRILNSAEKNRIKTWIEQGAEYETHWAFVTPPEEISVPETDNNTWVKNPIDSFILARLEKEKLSPTQEAPPERWLRRVTFDLTGLPPAQPEIDAFLAEKSPSGKETVVDRLLASPRFGEHMATPWLDVARYADSFGYQADTATRAWPYRDWVIRAFNRNLPINEFIIDQIAGDLLPDATREQKTATAFNRIHRKTNEAGSVVEEYRQEGISDRVHTVGTAFMGLTFECARCHDHKYDPITAEDYYSLGAFFNSIDEHPLLQGGKNKGTLVPAPALQLPTPAQEAALTTLEKNVANAEAALASHIAGSDSIFQQWFSSEKSFPSLDLAARFEFEGKSLKNSVEKGKPAKIGSNKLVPGKKGNALLTDGDSTTTLPSLNIRHAEQPFSVSLWLKPAETYPRAIVFANLTTTGVNYSGFALVLEEGRLSWTLSREAPGCAASILTVEPIPTGQWSHITVTNDGSRKASGLRISVNSVPVATITVCDSLTRGMVVGGKIGLGARGGDSGLRGGMIDGLSIHMRDITRLEVAMEYGKEGSHSDDMLREYYFSAIDPVARKLSLELKSTRAAFRKEQEGVLEVMTMRESSEPVPAHILTRGDYTMLAEKVGRETPDWLPPFPEDLPRNRLGFAKWLTSPDHPLTARVTINRIWQETFGRGLVATSDNFGIQGEQPSHPELLDWLARDFMNHGWDHKRAVKQMVLSATYGQDSAATLDLRERDPDNALLARGSARRLSAEQLRDSALALSGLLAETIGGPSVKPYQAPGSMWKTLNNFLPVYKQDTGDGLYRRSLYTFWRRTTTPPNMMIFDAAARDVCATSRQATNTPLQSLVMLNDPQFVEAARKLGERILKHGGATDENRAKWAYREVTGKAPTSDQLPLLLELISGQREFFRSESSEAQTLLKVGESKPGPSIDPTESATFAMLAQALLNLDANITLR